MQERLHPGPALEQVALAAAERVVRGAKSHVASILQYSQVIAQGRVARWAGLPLIATLAINGCVWG